MQQNNQRDRDIFHDECKMLFFLFPHKPYVAFRYMCIKLYATRNYTHICINPMCICVLVTKGLVCTSLSLCTFGFYEALLWREKRKTLSWHLANFFERLCVTSLVEECVGEYFVSVYMT